MESLHPGTGVSEKRITRMAIINVLLILTIVDFFSNGRHLDWTIFSTWLGFAGYDGYRITQEKRFSSKTEVEGPVQKTTQTTQASTP